MDPFSPITPLTTAASPFAGAGVSEDAQAADKTNAKSFISTLQDAFDSMNEQQNKASDMTVAYATGKTNDLASVMFASQEATISFQLASQVRNKVVEAYQSIMQTQM